MPPREKEEQHETVSLQTRTTSSSTLHMMMNAYDTSYQDCLPLIHSYAFSMACAHVLACVVNRVVSIHPSIRMRGLWPD